LRATMRSAWSNISASPRLNGQSSAGMSCSRRRAAVIDGHACHSPAADSWSAESPGTVLVIKQAHWLLVIQSSTLRGGDPVATRPFESVAFGLEHRPLVSSDELRVARTVRAPQHDRTRLAARHAFPTARGQGRR
jgi:hypothetical protein